MDINERILDTSRRVFAKNGYKNVKTDALAKEIGISKRTLYEYYDSKEAIFTAVVENDIEDTKVKMSEIIRRMENDTIDFIEELKNIWDIVCDKTREYTTIFYSDMQKYTPGLWDRMEVFKDELIKRDFYLITSIGVKKGCFRNDINEHVAFLMYYHSVRNIMTPDVLSNLPLTAQDVLGNIYEIMFMGILTEEARVKYLAVL